MFRTRPAFVAGKDAGVPYMAALDKLKLITAWDIDPALTEGELNDVLEAAEQTDSNGFGPGEEDWSPTFDLNRAAADAWLIKAARAASLVEVTPPESGIVTSKVFDNCRQMARIYSAKRSATISISKS